MRARRQVEFGRKGGLPRAFGYDKGHTGVGDDGRTDEHLLMLIQPYGINADNVAFRVQRFFLDATAQKQSGTDSQNGE